MQTGSADTAGALTVSCSRVCTGLAATVTPSASSSVISLSWVISPKTNMPPLSSCISLLQGLPPHSVTAKVLPVASTPRVTCPLPTSLPRLPPSSTQPTLLQHTGLPPFLSHTHLFPTLQPSQWLFPPPATLFPTFAHDSLPRFTQVSALAPPLAGSPCRFCILHYEIMHSLVGLGGTSALCL